MIIAESVAKCIHFVSTRLLHCGGETWPGEVARYFLGDFKGIAHFFETVILVVGTNGKTSTTKIMVEAMRSSGFNVLTNASGANMLNGVLSSILVQKKFTKNTGYVGVFEVDEFSLGNVLSVLPATHILFLNVMRDQLDRYGEVRNILGLWKKELEKHKRPIVVTNVYDPGLSWVCENVPKSKLYWYGIPERFLKKDTTVLGDSSHCFFCNHKLNYTGIYVSHLGAWNCDACKKTYEKSFTWEKQDLQNFDHLPDYMTINMQGAYLVAHTLGISKEQFFSIVSAWKPAYGRGETKEIHDATVTFMLGKNPASWTVALRDSLKKKKYSTVILGLNNQIPDGLDVSWIYDADIDSTNLRQINHLWVYGDRASDMAVRLHMEGIEVEKIWMNAKECFTEIKKMNEEVLILSNYTAMLESRRALLGKAIL